MAPEETATKPLIAIIRQHPLLGMPFFSELGNERALNSLNRASFMARQLQQFALMFPHIFGTALEHLEGLKLTREACLGQRFSEKYATFQKFLEMMPFAGKHQLMPEMENLLRVFAKLAADNSAWKVAGFLAANEYVLSEIYQQIILSMLNLGLILPRLEYFSLHTGDAGDKILPVVEEQMTEEHAVLEGLSQTLDIHFHFWSALARQLPLISD